MSTQASVQTQTMAKPTITSITNGLLQRACACGQHTAGGGGDCEECKKKRQYSLQRAAINSSSLDDMRSLPERKPVLQRSPKVGWADRRPSSLNLKPNSVGKIRRIPLDGLAQGNQDESAGSSESAKGRAIVLLHPDFKSEKDAEILLHFHGRNAGYRQQGKVFRDRDTDRIEQQIEASGNPQLIGILPQGTNLAVFGKVNNENAFNSDAYFGEVLTTLKTTGMLATVPRVSNVMLSGHSGAGELINEKLLGGASTSSLPSKFGTLKEVALFDAINGPHEFDAIKDWIEKSLDADLNQLNHQTDNQAKLQYLKTSMRFRAYYSDTSNGSYTRWHVGPVKNSKVKDSTPVKQFIENWFNQHASELGGITSAAYQALQQNYRVIYVGHADHDAILSRGDQLLDALKVFPKRETGAPSEQAEVPAIVHDVLSSPGKSLDAVTRTWAETHFNRDFSHVRVHADQQANESAEAVQALAYTVGKTIVFGSGQYETGTSTGRALLAHELTHVVQQSNALSSPTSRLKIAAAHDPLEAQAEQQSRRVEASVRVPLLQRTPDQNALGDIVCATTKGKEPSQAKPGECLYKFPENCPTYEGWISSFTELRWFKARATPEPGPDPSEGRVFTVVGQKVADRYPHKGEVKPSPNAPVRPWKGVAKFGEHFIDHPTENWVKACLPENLRATAYQLPADCADIAIILRHVWLSAHHRTEKFGKFTLGSKTGGAEASEILTVIANVGTESVAAMVSPYSDTDGRILRSFEKLESRLHVGDILVWDHFDNGFDKKRTGGHTHTIMGIERSAAGKISKLHLLQGNEPIFGEKKPIPKGEQIPATDDKGLILKEEKKPDTEDLRKQLGHAPGRRIERAELSAPFPASNPKIDKTPEEIWKWGASTILVAAGPPLSAPRPAMQKGSKVRQLSDWIASFNSASFDTLPGILEAMLMEARSMIDGGGDITEAEARKVSESAGRRFWSLAKKEGGLANKQLQRLQELRAIITGLKDSTNLDKKNKSSAPRARLLDKLSNVLTWIDESFHLAARGSSDIDFAAGIPAKMASVKILLTGFDPFEPSGSLKPPAPGQWNPSGAAVLALDNQRLPVMSSKRKKATAALEGVVLPVDYATFRSGIVEKIVTPHANEVDAVVTVSMAPIAPDDPVRLERYAVGVHEIEEKGQRKLEAIPPFPDKSSLGHVIIESPAPLEEIASGTGVKKKGRSDEIPTPTVGEQIAFTFANAKDADSALKALGLPTQAKATVTIDDAVGLKQIFSTMKRLSDGVSISFSVGAKTFTAKVVKGPGGNFLSNEVSYRVLRLLSQAKSPKDPISFHVHTQTGEEIPQDTSAKEARKAQKQAIGRATGVKDRLIATLKRMITTVARIILDRRDSAQP
jgi:hypothetical protein